MMDILYRRDNFDKFIRKLLPHIDPTNSSQFDSTVESDSEATVHTENIESSGSESEENHELVHEHANGMTLTDSDEAADELYSDCNNTENIGIPKDHGSANNSVLESDQNEESGLLDDQPSVAGIKILLIIFLCQLLIILWHDNIQPLFFKPKF